MLWYSSGMDHGLADSTAADGIFSTPLREGDGCLNMPSSRVGPKRSHPSPPMSSPRASRLFHSGVFSSPIADLSWIVWCFTELTDPEKALDALRGIVDRPLTLAFCATTFNLEDVCSASMGDFMARASPLDDLGRRKLPLLELWE